MTKLAAVSVDLDEIDCYAAIHGLLDDSVSRTGMTAVYDRCIARLQDVFSELSIPVTWFAIGRDLAREQNRARLRALHAQGHEIGNHTLSHYYDLTRRSRDEMLREVVGGADAIERAVGVRPVGFRAPGYTIHDPLFEVLEEAGVTYDSSVFPCPAYYSAKTAAIGLIRARGRRSRSVVDHPRVLTAPAEPYRVGKPYTRRGPGLLEFPIGVTGNASGRLPYIGTTLVLWGEAGARRLSRLASSREFVNLELHGIDLADAHEDELEWLAPYQRDLQRTASEKRAALCAGLLELRARGYEFVTLAEAAKRV